MPGQTGEPGARLSDSAAGRGAGLGKSIQDLSSGKSNCEDMYRRHRWLRYSVAMAQSSRQPDIHEPPLLSEESPDGVDLTLIRWTLSLTPLERLELLQDWVDGLTELRHGRIA